MGIKAYIPALGFIAEQLEKHGNPTEVDYASVIRTAIQSIKEHLNESKKNEPS